MTTDTAPAMRRTLPERLRWVIGLLVFAAACYAVFGWLYDRELRDSSGNSLSPAGRTNPPWRHCRGDDGPPVWEPDVAVLLTPPMNPGPR